MLPAKKTGETVDRRQNNGSVKAVSPRHCPATSALRNCCFTAVLGQSQGQCPLHCCWGTTRSERSPTFAAQLHLLTHDLFWANLKVQLHLLPLGLLIFWSRLEPGGGGGGGQWGGRLCTCHYTDSHHQNDFCIKMGSDESHFNVSVGSDGQSHKTVSTNHNFFEEKGKPKQQYRTVPRSRLPPTSPNALSLGQTCSHSHVRRGMDP